MPRRKDAAPMRRLALAVALAAGSLAAAPARADDEKKPDQAHLAKAAEQFDAGVTAYKQKDYESAAAHFEAADAAVPGPKALRQAIRARVEAGQGARAATLAAQALERYPGDDATTKLARDTVDKYKAILHKVRVRCASPCTLSVGSDRVPGEAAKRWVIYLDPGAASVAATFSGHDGGDKAQDVDAKAGAEADLAFEPAKAKPTAPPLVAGTPSKAELPPDDPKPADAKADEPKPEGKGIHPAFFGVSLAVTTALGATTIWSGVDTLNNPGTAAVMAACQGKGPSCPLYQEGLSKQSRTDALLGATVGAAALTGLLAIFTRWHGAKAPPPAEPTALVVDRGAVLGASGAF
jgi:hypothetical protein